MSTKIKEEFVETNPENNGGPVPDSLLRYISARLLIRSTLDVLSPKMDKKINGGSLNAQDWFDEDEIYPLSITAVCEVLQLDKHLVRKKIIEWKNNPEKINFNNPLGSIKKECVINAIKSGKRCVETLASDFMLSAKRVKAIATEEKLEVYRMPTELCLRKCYEK